MLIKGLNKAFVEFGTWINSVHVIPSFQTYKLKQIGF